MTAKVLSCSYCGEFDVCFTPLPDLLAHADASQNFGAVMSVSEDLLCSFELLKPLDGAALKKEMTKSKRKRWVHHCSSSKRSTLPLLPHHPCFESFLLP